MKYSIFGTELLLEIRVKGEITANEIREYWRELELNTLFEKASVGVVVFEDNPKWNVTGNELVFLARDVARLRAIKWALVCSDLLSFGMARMFATFAEGGGAYEVFSTEETARDWVMQVISGRR